MVVRNMIFDYITDDHSLEVFPNMETAISKAEGIDVEEGLWLFFPKMAVLLSQS